MKLLHETLKLKSEKLLFFGTFFAFYLYFFFPNIGNNWLVTNYTSNLFTLILIGLFSIILILKNKEFKLSIGYTPILLIFCFQSLPLLLHPSNINALIYSTNLALTFFISLALYQTSHLFLSRLILYLKTIGISICILAILNMDIFEINISYLGSIILNFSLLTLISNRSDKQAYFYIDLILVIASSVALLILSRRIELALSLFPLLNLFVSRFKKLKSSKYSWIFLALFIFTITLNLNNERILDLINLKYFDDYNIMNRVTSGRVDLYTRSLEIVYHNLYKGVGILNLPLSHFDQKMSHIHTHNEFLQQTLQSGIISSTLQLMLLLIFILLIIRGFKQNSTKLTPIVVLLILLIDWSLTRHYPIPSTQLFLSLYLAILIKKTSLKEFKTKQVNLIGFIFIFVLLFNVYLRINQIKIDSHTLSTLKTRNIVQKNEIMLKALSISSLSPNSLVVYARICLSLKSCEKKYIEQLKKILPHSYLSLGGMYLVSKNKDKELWYKAYSKAPKKDKKLIMNLLSR